MKYMKKTMILLMTTISICLGLLFQMKHIEASNLVVVKASNGTDLTYRNSNEKVYRLEEYNYPTSQLRAAWVTVFAGDIAAYSSESQYKSMMHTVLDNMQKMGMNAIIYHVRTHNNAMYKSELNPLASWWRGVNFDTFDPLEWLIEECHNRGIEFHAWLNPYRISTNGQNPSFSAESLPAVNPANNPDNLITVGNNIIFDPGIPEVRDFLVDTCMELVENYDVDAIHFDDYFYISGANDENTRAKYNTENLSIANFRRKQVDLFIESLSKEVRSYNVNHNKCVQIGISPSNVYQNGGYTASPTYDANGTLISPTYSNTAGFAHYGDYLYSDTLNWINHEWIDYIMPQCYHPIEQDAASYAELVKWWSWAVRYKKVNLYTGIGIYMTLETNEYWKRNVNEVQLQLLISGQYKEFKGASFYKYSTLLNTSNATIAHAVDTISNDYWKVKIPGAVVPYYAPLLDEVDPTGIVYDKTNHTLSWNPVEQTRGYMVYQVPKGSRLNQEDISQVYCYTQQTTIELAQDPGYDYYVASVNLANETSKGALVSIALEVEEVIALINQIPQTITLEHKSQIEHIRTVYNLLSPLEQASVTNYQKLVDAEAQLAAFADLETTLNDYIQFLDKEIQTNRILPTPDYIQLSYQNASDQQIYDLETGVRYKNYLATTKIGLIATLEHSGKTVSKSFEVNVGLTRMDQEGLFYRNDPSAIGAEDKGNYSPGSSGYIGWSGHRVVVDRYVLYITGNENGTNYQEITDPTQIERCIHISAAGVYVNKTQKAVTMKLTDAYESKSGASDGYFIIANEKIKEVQTGFDTNCSIILAPGEAIVITRYLDGLINGSPFVPVTKLEVGTKAYIDQETGAPIIPQEVKDIIEQINQITTPITLNQENLIVSIQHQYELLSPSNQQLVTNQDQLFEAIRALNELKQQLEQAQTTYIQKIGTLINSYDVSDAIKQELIKQGEAFKEQIRQAVSVSDIEYIWTRVVATCNEYFENLENAKNQAKTSIQKFIDELTYNEAEMTIIVQAQQAAIAAIDEMADIEAIRAYPTDFIQQIETTHEDLEQAKANAKEELSKLQQQWYTDAQNEYIGQMTDKTMANIILCGTKQDVMKLQEECKNNVQTYITEITEAIDEAITEISQKEMPTDPEITGLIVKTKQQIARAQTILEVEGIVDAFNTQYNQKLTLEKENILKALDKWGVTIDYIYQDAINQAIQKTDEAIQKAQIIQEVQQAYAIFQQEVEQWILPKRQEIKDKMTNYIKNLAYPQEELDQIGLEKEKLFAQIDAYHFVDDMEHFFTDFKKIVQSIHQETPSVEPTPPAKGCSNCNSTVVMWIYITITIVLVGVTFKKHASR
ncbi:MAG: family 10 glycosylhydrolase [Anaeroplasma bactoclasticum]|nr:family 10 glycosylhydrolase [Anaeroplasma bactoclasticum]